ncbi:MULTISPECIES: cell division protein FtsL [unclassified Adlercreutzia]|uniref:cell division protein FtsL n=1 Tax=unclassified Adlercreutzia TaxID=2636013 RepID=UPI0013ED57B9|nr:MULTISPECIES: cell division protein FtsL [unclassified Adlercreutzia]
MGAAPAYSAYAQRQAARSSQWAPARTTRDRIDVVPGRRAHTTHPVPQQSSAVFVAKVVAVVLLVVAVMGIARIALTTATVTTSIQSQELSSQIEDARSNGVALEASQTVLASSTRVKNMATGLGMAAPTSVENLTLPEDVVATDANGALSLSKSLDRVANAGE